MKIIFANCGYLTGLTGQLNEYILLSWRYFFGGNKVSQILIDTIKYEQPDVCLFVEIKRGEVRNILENLPEYEHSVSVEKYGVWPLSKIGKANVHLVLSNKPFENINKIKLNSGQKRTVLEVGINGFKIYTCHLSLNSGYRKKQILELSNILSSSTRSILAGDFNTFKGSVETIEITKHTPLINLNPKNTATFPAFKPKQELDYIFASRDISEKSFVVLPEVFSDHRALMCSVE